MDYESHRDFTEFSGFSTNLIQEHFHRSIEFLYCERGERLCTINGEDYILSTGELLIVPPFATHKYDNDAICYCFVLPVSYSDIWEKYTHGKSVEDFIIKDKFLAKDLQQHLEISLSAKNKLIKNGAIEYVLGKILAECEFSSTKKTTTPDFSKDVVMYIEDNFSRDLSLDSVAKYFGYSKYYFSNLFNKYFKMNFKTYLNNVRVSKAKSMLKRKTIAEVSDACGYNNLQSFFLNFKKITGLTPKEYLNTTK